MMVRDHTDELDIQGRYGDYREGKKNDGEEEGFARGRREHSCKYLLLCEQVKIK